MAVRTIDEIMDALRARLGEDLSDETIVFIEDVNDTLSNYERMTAESIDWESRYKELDQEWRKRYRDRFFERSESEEKDSFHDDINDIEDQEDKAPETFEELFEEVKKEK